MLLFPSEEIDKKFNFSINIYMYFFYILPTHSTQFLVQRQRTLDLPRRGIYTKIISRSAECKAISMN